MEHLYIQTREKVIKCFEASIAAGATRHQAWADASEAVDEFEIIFGSTAELEKKLDVNVEDCRLVTWNIRVLSCKCLHNDFIQNILLFHSRELSIICCKSERSSA